MTTQSKQQLVKQMATALKGSVPDEMWANDFVSVEVQALVDEGAFSVVDENSVKYVAGVLIADWFCPD
jgi:hypothetical protein